ncbi:MAG: hypothetical protein WC234_06870 [Endomicrobiaceae bacterium]|jgi:Txe/YoeB family toxin of Txe-Axe toxin-antitoxin module
MVKQSKGNHRTVTFIQMHLDFLKKVKEETGINSSETIRRALELLIESDRNPLKIKQNYENH